MATRITDVQAEVLRELLYRFHDGRSALAINPTEAYPQRNNEDSAKRRTIRKLYDAGLLERDPAYPSYANVFRLKSEARAAYEEWYRRRGFKLD